MKKPLGFTLVEMVVVILVIGVFSTFVYFSLQNTPLNLAAQAEQLANDIRYAQTLAMTTSVRYRWIKTTSNSYQIQNSSGTPIILAQGNTTVILNGNNTFGGFSNLPNNLVNFDGEGTPYVDTAIPGTPLSATATITISNGTSTSTISIAPTTGGVTIS